MLGSVPMPLCNQNLHQIPHPGGYCTDCARCAYCQRPLTVLEYQWCQSVAAKYEIPIEFKHPSCAAQLRGLDLASESVSIPKAYFDYLNAARLLIEPIPELNPKTNSLDAELKTHQFIHEMKLDDIFLFVKRMESIASTGSLIIAKHRRELEAKFSEKDQQKFKEARAVRTAHEVKAPATRARVEKRILTKEEKAIAALTALGLSDAEARDSIRRKIQ
jgi:hypothetical protein